MRRVVLLAGLAAALVWATQASPHASCTSGVHSAGGVTYRTFCGTAHATLHFGGKTYRFTGGDCERTGSSFAINLGTITLPPGKPKYRYFGIAVFTAHDGTFQDQAVSWQFPTGDHNSLFHVKLVLAGNRTRGTFAGTTLADRAPGSGTFHC